MLEVNIIMKSSNIAPGQNLARIPARRLRKFLLSVVNSNGSADAGTWFKNQFEDFFSPTWLDWSARLPGSLAARDFWGTMLLIQRDHLREIWSAPDMHTAQWRTFTLRYREHDNMPPGLQRNKDAEPPAPVPLQQALLYLQQNIELRRHCANPDCAGEPYFFASR